MWIMIVMLMLSFACLLHETDFMRIRLKAHGYPEKQAMRANSEGLKSETNTIMPIKRQEDDKPYSPTVFIPLDMPELTGNINILCKKGE